MKNIYSPVVRLLAYQKDVYLSHHLGCTVTQPPTISFPLQPGGGSSEMFCLYFLLLDQKSNRSCLGNEVVSTCKKSLQLVMRNRNIWIYKRKVSCILRHRCEMQGGQQHLFEGVNQKLKSYLLLRKLVGQWHLVAHVFSNKHFLHIKC